MEKMNKAILDNKAFPELLDAVKRDDEDGFTKKCEKLGLDNDMIKKIWKMADPDKEKKKKPGYPCW